MFKKYFHYFAYHISIHIKRAEGLLGTATVIFYNKEIIMLQLNLASKRIIGVTVKKYTHIQTHIPLFVYTTVQV